MHNDGSFLPIWSLTPWEVALWVFGVNFVAISIIGRIFEGRFGRDWGLAWWIGDTIGLPLYFGFAVAVLHHDSAHKISGEFYTKFSWQSLVLVWGFAMAVGQQMMTHRQWFGWWRKLTLTERYHTLVLGLLLYLGAGVLLPVSHLHQPMWAAIPCFAGLSLYGVPYLYDRTPYARRRAEARKKRLSRPAGTLLTSNPY